MSKKYLSKRRKNHLIMQELKYYYCNIESESNAVSNIIKTTEISLKNVNNLSNNKSNTMNNTLIANFDEIHDSNIELYSHTKDMEEHNIETQNNNEEPNIEIQNSILEINNDIDYIMTNPDGINKFNLETDLRRLIVEQNIPHNTANQLLAILRKYGHIELPKDIRVLLQTPRKASINIKNISGGRYIHFGFLSGLKRSIQTYSKFIKNNEIKININIDGLPISKNSGSQLWSIMASIENIDIYTLSFIIGIYHGMHKPNNANEFLLHFVNEFTFLSQTGIIVSEKKYVVILNVILCDAPAKSFITYTKGHNGYFSCSKCTQEGDFIRNRVVFPEIRNTLRTDDMFRNRNQIEHHTGDSILEQLPIDMVSQIPLDYMHLVCLGIVKRLLQLWTRGNRTIRLSAENVNSVSHHLIAIKYHITSEFARKPRSLDDIDKWKATEFRQFLLYTGIVVMKSILSPICYIHFLSLSVAIRILIDEQYCVKFNAYAKSLLLWFVANYGNIYGNEYISHNVHNLLHLANDVQRFGSLDNFSCFKYENHMQKLKRKLHQSGSPLEQLSNRSFEESQLPIVPCVVEPYPFVVYNKNHKISYIQFKTFQIAENDKDNCAVLSDQFVVFILNIFEENNIVYIRAQRFLNPESIFTTPCSSQAFGIYLISNTTNSDIITIPVTQIRRKCLKIKSLHEIGSYVTIPMLLNNN